MAKIQEKTFNELKVSVVIPTYKRPQLALRCAQTIRKFHKNIEIIIVDQKESSDINKKELQKINTKLFNLGYDNTSDAKNKGIEKASGEVVFFFDDDIEITAKTIPEQLKKYEDENVVATSGRVINDGEKIPKETNVKTGKVNFLATKFLQQFWSTKEQCIDFPYGCNMSYKKEVLEKCGGFDKNFPKIFEEIDLGKRVKKYGKIAFAPQALAYHHKAKTGGTRTKDINKQKMIFENYGYYMSKNVIFPFSLITLFLRTITVLKESPNAFFSLHKGYLRNFFKFNFWFLISLGLIIYLRTFKVMDFFTFNFDEEYQAHLAYSQVKDFHAIWIGVSASNLGYYLGPGFTYLNAFLFKLTNGGLSSIAWFSAFFGIITTLSVYYVTKEIFSKKAAFYAFLIYGFSSLIILFDRRFWNPTPIPFITIWMLFAFYKFYKNSKYLILIALLIGASFHIHLSLMLFWPIIYFVVFQNFKKIKLSTWIYSILIYLFATSPLIVFDFVHNFDNLLAPIKFFQNIGAVNHRPDANVFYSHFLVFWAFLSRIWFLKFETNIQEEHNLGTHGALTGPINLLTFFSAFILMWFTFLQFVKKEYRILFFVFFVFVFGFIFYPGVAGEYYLLPIFSLLPIIFGLFFESIPNILGVLIMIIFITHNFFTIKTLTQKQYGANTRIKLVNEISNFLSNKEFSLETYGIDPRKYHPYGGWRYLFRIYGKTPAKSFADEFFGWIYQDEIKNIEPKYKVVISEEFANFKYKNKNEKVLKSFKEGVFKADIILNKSLYKLIPVNNY